MTLRLMERWGASGTMRGGEIVVPGGQRYAAQTNFEVEPDASSASYFAAAAALVGGSVMLVGLSADSVQGDIAFMKLLERMGAHVEWREDGVKVSGRGTSQRRRCRDERDAGMVPTLAAIAPFCSSPTRIRGVSFIRHHESDRLRALATELHRLGASVHECEDGMLIEPSRIGAAAVETYDDHRIAMAFAVAGLKTAGISIRNPGCVSKTYPNFFRDLARLSSPQARRHVRCKGLRGNRRPPASARRAAGFGDVVTRPQHHHRLLLFIVVRIEHAHLRQPFLGGAQFGLVGGRDLLGRLGALRERRHHAVLDLDQAARDQVLERLPVRGPDRQQARHQRGDVVDVVGEHAELAERIDRVDLLDLTVEQHAGRRHQLECERRRHRDSLPSRFPGMPLGRRRAQRASPRARRSALARASSIVPTR